MFKNGNTNKHYRLQCIQLDKNVRFWRMCLRLFINNSTADSGGYTYCG